MRARPDSEIRSEPAIGVALLDVHIVAASEPLCLAANDTG